MIIIESTQWETGDNWVFESVYEPWLGDYIRFLTYRRHVGSSLMVTNDSTSQIKSTGIHTSDNNLRLRSFYSMILPRSSNYERLESGLGPNRMAKKFGWKKFAIAAGVLLALLYLFGPRAHKTLPWKTKSQQRPIDLPGKSIHCVI